MCAFLGMLIQKNIPTILNICMRFAIIMILIPRMVDLMMKDVTSIGNAANTFIKKHVNGSDGKFYIDMALLLVLLTATVIYYNICNRIYFPYF